MKEKCYVTLYGVRICKLEQIPCEYVKECPLSQENQFVKAFSETLKMLKQAEGN